MPLLQTQTQLSPISDRELRISLRKLLSQNHGDLAILIGNGINQYNASSTSNSWDHLLSEIAKQHIGPVNSKKPDGISHTEFYDVLSLAVIRKAGDISLAQQFCQLMETWQPLEQHKTVTTWAKKFSIPILTTNFDKTLSEAAGAIFRKSETPHFTARYPWATFFGNNPISDPCSEFAIWHVHGLMKYPSSIRLGLSDYMAAVSRARNWLHTGDNRLFGNEGGSEWLGANTWLHVFFHKPLLILGQGLTETEVFLRWLFIERAKYYKNYPRQKKDGWYVYKDGELSAGKELFLTAVGITPLCVNDYHTMYSKSTWKFI